MSTQPKSIAGNESLIQVYNNIPKRTLWDILWDAAARLCPIGQESVDQATSEPQARGSIVEWIMGEAIVRECWLPKSILTTTVGMSSVNLSIPGTSFGAFSSFADSSLEM